MRIQLTYRIFNIPTKLDCEIQLSYNTADTRRQLERINESNGDKYITLALVPFVVLSINRSGGQDDNGNWQRPTRNPNDRISLMRYHLPIFVSELKDMQRKMKTPELYTYMDKRLVLNEDLATQFHQKFTIRDVILELSPVVILQPDDTRVEGVKMKFNSEESTVLLTINDLTSMIMNLCGLDLDSVTLNLYTNFIRDYAGRAPSQSPMTYSRNGPVVDIKPREVTNYDRTTRSGESEYQSGGRSENQGGVRNDYPTTPSISSSQSSTIGSAIETPSISRGTYADTPETKQSKSTNIDLGEYGRGEVRSYDDKGSDGGSGSETNKASSTEVGSGTRTAKDSDLL